MSVSHKTAPIRLCEDLRIRHGQVIVHATDHPAALQIMNRVYFITTKTRELIEQIKMDLGALHHKLLWVANS